MREINKFLIFCLVGGTGATIELIIFNLLFYFLNFPSSKLIGLLASLTFVFLMNRNITFSASKGKRRKQIPRYILIYFIGILLNYVSSILANQILGEGLFYRNFSVIIGILIGIPITFLGSKYWVFKS